METNYIKNLNKIKNPESINYFLFYLELYCNIFFSFDLVLNIIYKIHNHKFFNILRSIKYYLKLYNLLIIISRFNFNILYNFLFLKSLL